MVREEPCQCNTYPFPHRPSSGTCPGSGWCPNCHAPLSYKWQSGRGEYGENEQEAVCDDCGWRDS